MVHLSLESEKVGIVLATYNPDLDHFREQFHSIQNQTFGNWCCYIVDDCSEVSIKSQIAKLCSEDIRFQFVSNSYQLGVYHNFEKGLKLASNNSELTAIAFCDQDDIWLPTKLECLLMEMRKQDALLVHSDLEIISSDGQTLFPSCWQYEGRRPEAVSLELLLLRNTVTGCSMLFRSSLLKYVLPFPEQIRSLWYHDAWVAVIAAYFGKVASVRKPLVKYRQHGLNNVGAARNDGSLIRELKLWIIHGNLRVTGNTYLKRQLLADAVLTRINTFETGVVASLPFSSQRRDFGASVLWLGLKSCLLGCGATGVVIRAVVGNLYLDLRKSLGAFKKCVRQLIYQKLQVQKCREFEYLLGSILSPSLPSPKLFILHNDPYKSVNSIRGGTERHVADLVKYLSKTTPIFILYQNQKCRSIFVRAFYQGRQLSLSFPIPGIVGSFFLSDESYKLQSLLTSIIRLINPSIVHIHHLLNLPIRDVYAVLKKLKVPYILSLHDFYHICPSFNLISHENVFCYPRKNEAYCRSCIQTLFAQGHQLKAEWWKVNAALLLGAQHRIAPSRTVLNYFQKEYPAIANQESTVIAHGVSDDIYTHYLLNSDRQITLNRVDSHRGQVLNIAFVGHISRIKGADNISKVFEWIANSTDEKKIEFYIFGSFQGYIPPAAKDRVHLFGSYQHRELPNLLKQHHIDVVAIPSICAETYGLVADEVLSFGIPVITTPITAIAERVIQHQIGWVTQDCSALALFETIQSIDTNCEEFNRILANIQNYPVSSTAQMVNQYAQIYEKVEVISIQPVDAHDSREFSKSELLSAYLAALKFDYSFQEILPSPQRLPLTKRWQIAQSLKRKYPRIWEFLRILAIKYGLIK